MKKKKNSCNPQPATHAPCDSPHRPDQQERDKWQEHNKGIVLGTSLKFNTFYILLKLQQLNVHNLENALFYSLLCVCLVFVVCFFSSAGANM